jgi:hypothetical protein
VPTVAKSIDDQLRDIAANAAKREADVAKQMLANIAANKAAAKK